MATKDEAEELRDVADRIVRLALARRLERLAVNDDADTEVTIPPAVKQQWADKIAALKIRAKELTALW